MYFYVLWSVDGAESGENIQVVLAESDAVVFEAAYPLLIPVPTQDTVFFGNANDPLYAG